jgi:1-acyl-sn-glycerol-3-phosphate acyltransferase
LIRALSKLILRLGGWRAEGDPPAFDKYVIIAAPHTTNWDFVWVLAFAGYYGIRIRWVGKHTLFRAPFGRLMQALGGIPVRRDRRQSFVQQMADLFQRDEPLRLVVAVEGSRSYGGHWKSGFYHIARTAGVPIAMSYLDYGQRRGGFGPILRPSGDIRRDMDQLRTFYADKSGKYPAKSGPIRLVEESEPA